MVSEDKDDIASRGKDATELRIKMRRIANTCDVKGIHIVISERKKCDMNQKDIDELMERAAALIVRTIEKEEEEEEELQKKTFRKNETEEAEELKEKKPCIEECVEVQLVKVDSTKKKRTPQDTRSTEKVYIIFEVKLIIILMCYSVLYDH